jgi:hypothetical protein
MRVPLPILVHLGLSLTAHRFFLQLGLAGGGMMAALLHIWVAERGRCGRPEVLAWFFLLLGESPVGWV